MESAAEDDSVGFDFQILHQSAATGEDARFSIQEIPFERVSARAPQATLCPKRSVMGITSGRLLPAAT